MAASSLDSFLWAIAQQESGGNYKSVGPNIGGDHAYGKYQVMGANVPSWTQRALGHSMTPQEYLNSPSAQEAVARSVLGGYYQKYGAAGAAAMWYSGQPDPNKTYGSPSVRDYVRQVLGRIGSAPPGGAANATPADTWTTTGATAASYKDDPTCLVGMDIPLVGGVCLLSKGQARAIEGGLLLIAGGVVAAAGLVILAAYGLKATGALDGVAKAAAVVPGAGGLAARAISASGALKAGPKPRAKAPKAPKGTSDGTE